MLSKFSVQKPYTVVVAVIIIAILGGVSFVNMSTDLFPSINIPYAIVSTPYIGASPEEVELTVTSAIEQSMASISNIKNVRSVSQEHMSLIILEFNQKANMDSAVIEMRESLDLIKGFLPEGVGSSVIIKLNPDMMPVMVLSAAIKDMEISQSSQFLSSYIIPELESVDGIASIVTTGLVDNYIHVVLNDEKIEEINEKMKNLIMETMMAQAAMQANAGAMPQSPMDQNTQATQGDDTMQSPMMNIPSIEITKEMIANILKGQNFSMPAGYIAEGNNDYLVRIGDKVNNIDELKSLPILSLEIEGMDTILLEDVADILVIDNSSEMYTKVNGNDAIILTIQKQTAYATSEVASNIRDKIDELMEKHGDLELVPLMDQGEYIDVVVDSITKNLIYGGILAIFILLIFLKNIKPTIVVGFAIPVSLVTAFVMMYFSNITLNIISMGGLALGVGMLVDNSIVVIENIYRMRSEGKSAKDAAVEGATQVSGAIIASTLTTISVFVPILFTYGFTREIFMDMGLTIAYSLIASLIVALTLVPMLASNLMAKNIEQRDGVLNKLKKNYTAVLSFSLRHKWLVVIVAILLFAGSIFAAFTMGTEFFPASDTGQLMLELSMPKGSVFSETTAMSDQVVEIIFEIEGVETVGVSMGGGAFSRGGGMGAGRAVDSVSMYVLLTENRERSTSEIAQIIREKTEYLECEISINDSNMDMSAMAGSAIEINIRGRDFEVLEKIARDMAKILQSVEGTVEISDGLEETFPELRVIVNKEKSIAKGLTNAQIFMNVNKLLGSESAATKISVGINDYEIIVMDEDSQREISREDIANHIIKTPMGEEVKIKDVAEIVEGEGFSSIRRKNQQRYITVGAEIADGYNMGLVSREVERKIEEYKVPEGYHIEMGGMNRMTQDSFKDLFLMLALAIVFIYLIMVAQFQSLLSPFIIMFTIPLAFTGGFLGLMVTNKPVSVVAFVGLIVLAGVVVNNGIVFVDYINILRQSGMKKRDAIIKAGNDRLRPIVMTALTTIFALSTMGIGVGMGMEMVQPMAITAIGGLMYATLLTLVLIPVMYDTFHRREIFTAGEKGSEV